MIGAIVVYKLLLGKPAFTNEEDFTQRGIALGAKGYVTKPVKPSDLHALIETICAARG